MKITARRAPGNVAYGPPPAGRTARERIQGRRTGSPAPPGETRTPAVIPAGLRQAGEGPPTGMYACMDAGGRAASGTGPEVVEPRLEQAAEEVLYPCLRQAGARGHDARRRPVKAGPPAIIPTKAGIQWFRQDLPACKQAGMTINDKETLRKSPRNGLSPGWLDCPTGARNEPVETPTP